MRLFTAVTHSTSKAPPPNPSITRSTPGLRGYDYPITFTLIIRHITFLLKSLSTSARNFGALRHPRHRTITAGCAEAARHKVGTPRAAPSAKCTWRSPCKQPTSTPKSSLSSGSWPQTLVVLTWEHGRAACWLTQLDSHQCSHHF